MEGRKAELLQRIESDQDVLLDFFRRASEAATVALSELRNQGRPKSGSKRRPSAASSAD